MNEKLMRILDRAEELVDEALVQSDVCYRVELGEACYHCWLTELQDDIRAYRKDNE
jgi:hypothetical protein